MEGVFLLHDHARSYVSMNKHVKMAKFKCEQLHYAPYSLDMAPCDFHEFGPLKKRLKGQRFNSNTYSRMLWRTRSRYHHRSFESRECIGQLIDGIVVLWPMVHTLSKDFFYTRSVSIYTIWTHLVLLLNIFNKCNNIKSFLLFLCTKVY